MRAHPGVVFLFAGLGAVGCGDSEPPTYAYAFRIDAAPIDAPAPIPISLGGRALGSAEVTRELRVDIPRETWVSESAITTPLSTTCGVIDTPLRSDLTREDETYRRDDARDRPGETAVVRVALTPPAQARQSIYVDNRDGTSPALVTIGQLALEPVPPGGVWRGVITVGDCAEAPTVRVGDEEVGSIGSDRTGTQLVDVTGGHCYEQTAVVYQRAGAPSGAPPERTLHRAARVQRIEGVTYFLEEPPASIESTREVLAPTVLRHVVCP